MTLEDVPVGTKYLRICLIGPALGPETLIKGALNYTILRGGFMDTTGIYLVFLKYT